METDVITVYGTKEVFIQHRLSGSLNSREYRTKERKQLMKAKMKRFLSIVLSIAMVLGMMPGMNMTVKAATSMPAAVDGVVKLTEDVELSSTWEPSGTVTLDLNGFGIKKTGSGSVIKINNGASLTIIDSNPESTHKFSLNGGLAVLNEEEGDFTINGGYITGGTGTGENGYFWGSGGGIWVKNGTCTMNAGTVLGNSAGQGGGVCVYSGQFNLSGGTIAYNDVGVQLRSGSSQYNAGGASTATLNMTGGEIKNNTSNGVCGTNYCYGDSIANISAGIITNNGSTGVSAKKISISGSPSITNNRNIGLYASTYTLSGGPVINGNTAVVEGSEIPRNIYVPNNRIITVDGPLLNENAIGVTMGSADGLGVFAEAADTYNSGALSESDISKFCSDAGNGKYIVKNDDNKAEIVLHSHIFDNYTLSSDDTITATCSNVEGECTLPEVDGKHVVTLTIVASGTAGADFTGDMDAFENLPDINYYHANDDDTRGNALDPITNAPLDEGRYWAEFTLGGQTAHVIYGVEAVASIGEQKYTVLQNALNDVEDGQTIKMLADVKECVNFDKNNAVVTFDMNGHTLDGNQNGTVLTIKSGTLILDGDGVITGGKYNGSGGGVAINDGGTFKMNSGTIEGNSASNGGGVSIANNAVFEMNGGTIQYNEGYTYTAGVLLEGSASFTMSGGKIQFNVGKLYGGVGSAGAKTKFSGTAVVKDNVIFTSTSGKITKTESGYSVEEGGTPCDVRNTSSNPGMIEIVGELQSGAKIGVYNYMNGNEITTGYNTYNPDDDPANYFFSDDEKFTLIKDDNGEAILHLELLISSVDDWNEFVSEVNNGNTYAGTTVKLTQDIEGVTQYINVGNSFNGTFDGQNHIMIVNFQYPDGVRGAALFPTLKSGSITVKNLTLGGIISGGQHSTGIVGEVSNGNNDKAVNIENVNVVAEITQTSSHLGGILGHGGTRDTVTIKNCHFLGDMKSSAGTATAIGGIVGWGENSTTVHVSDSSFGGTCGDTSSFNPMVILNGAPAGNFTREGILRANKETFGSSAVVYATDTETCSTIEYTVNSEFSCDGTPHGIDIQVTEPADGAIITYGTEEGKYLSLNSPTLTEQGTTTVYYQIAYPNYNTVRGSATLSVTKKPAKVTKVPEAKSLIYDSSAQELVTAGATEGGTMQYAIGADATNEPESGWDTTIPTGTDAGNYYVWYKVVGDEYHLDVDANVVIVSIDKAPWINKMVFDSAPAGQEGSVNLSDYIAPGGHMGIAKLESGSQSSSYPSVDGTTLKFKFDDLVQGNETIADITIPVTGSANYTDYYITATVSAPAKKHQTLTFDSDKVSKKYGDEKFAVVPTQGAIEGYGDPYGTVSYTSDNVDVAEVSESGEVTIKKIGYAVITAKAERTAYESEARPGYLPATASYILTVIKGDPVVTAPGTKILNYNGQAQELVTAGAAKGGTMQYALGTDATTEPAAELYTTSIPTATDKGNYYVWYKVVGDENYNDSKADCVVAKIGAVISKTVTFKVVNGAWNDETTEEKTVTLIGYEGDTLKLAANQIPAAGNKPSDIYKAGSWDVTPDTETAITADTTYTYTYVEKNTISVNVTFKVVNGSWNEGEGDEATKDKPVTLTGHEGDTLKLAANQIPAVGNKPNDTYKAGSWDVTPSTDAGITKDMTYTYTYVAKETAVVTKAPEEKILTYNGQSQELVTAGEVTGGTMLYALGADATTEPAAELYKTSIPAGTDAGTYCVWYKVVGDENHTDVATDKINVTIAKKNLTVAADAKTITYGDNDAELTYKVTGLVEGDAQDKVMTGAITREAGTEAGTYRITQGTLASENYEITFTEADYTIKKAVQAAPEEQFTSTKSTNAENEDGKISGFDKEKAYQYSSDDGKTWTDVTGKTDVDVKAGTYLIRYAEDKNHESGQTVTITVEAEQQVVPEPEEQAVIINLKSVTQKKNKIQISWTKVKEADGYDVYVDYCGTKSKKAVKTIKKNSITKTSINKINGKKINQKKCFHAYVVAYKMVDGKKVKLAKTVAAHVAGAMRKGYTNPKTLKLTKSSFSIKVGKTAKIKAKVTLADSKKKHISKGHGAKLRYKSSNKKIASIDKNGKIKGIKKGTCTIYVYTINGIMKKAKVTVK